MSKKGEDLKGSARSIFGFDVGLAITKCKQLNLINKGGGHPMAGGFSLKIDFEEEPPFFAVSENHYAATWLLHEDAPKVEMPLIVKQRIEKYKAQEKAFQQSKGVQA